MMSLIDELTDKSVSRFKIRNGDGLYRMYVRYLSRLPHFKPTLVTNERNAWEIDHCTCKTNASGNNFNCSCAWSYSVNKITLARYYVYYFFLLFFYTPCIIIRNDSVNTLLNLKSILRLKVEWTKESLEAFASIKIKVAK
jgi:hypothetical protein